MIGYSFLLLILAAALDVGANLLLQKSDGLRRKKYAVLAILMVCLAFTMLAQVTKSVDLTVAYITWGALAILGTVSSARYFLGQKLNRVGLLGVTLILCAIFLLETA